MKTPRIKRRAQYIPAPAIPIDEFLKHCPLPPELAHLEPIMRGDFGQNLLTSVWACYAEGFTHAQLENVIRQVVEFYGQKWHRCNACHAWTDDEIAGAMAIDGRFVITVICPKCADLAASGRATEAMTTNMQEYIFGGAK